MRLPATHTVPVPAQAAPAPAHLLQRCACGGTPGPTGECAACRRKKKLGLQPKLRVNTPGDRYEREANRIADQVMRGEALTSAPRSVTPLVQRSGSDGTMTAPPAVDAVLARPGRALDGMTRQVMEQRFGHDFSQVRVHTGARADASARAMQAYAYTLGRHVVFRSGAYRPATRAGQRLLAHELTHYVQQKEGIRSTPSSSPSPTPDGGVAVQRFQMPTTPAEREAAERLTKKTLEETTRKTARKAGWRHFWSVIVRRFGIRGAAAVALAAADGPLPIGDLISLGLALWMIYDIITLWDLLWQLAEQEAKASAAPKSTKQAPPQPQPRPQQPTPTKEEEPQPRCQERPLGYHLGGDPIHNACADGHPLIMNVFPGSDYVVTTPAGLSKNFDAISTDDTLWEVKTETGTTATSDFLRKITIGKYAAEAVSESAIAMACGHPYAFAIADDVLYQHAQPRFASLGIRLEHASGCL